MNKLLKATIVIVCAWLSSVVLYAHGVAETIPKEYSLKL